MLLTVKKAGGGVTGALNPPSKSSRMPKYAPVSRSALPSIPLILRLFCFWGGVSLCLISSCRALENIRPQKGCAVNTPCVARPHQSKPSQELLIFISFSMPEHALKTLAQEAVRAGGRLILRGLVGNSMRETAVKLQKWGISVQIDPFLFKKHNVTAVPTFIQIEGGRIIHRITGHLPLSYVLKRFQEGK